MDDGLFEKFERLNALIDTWIDDENYGDVFASLNPTSDAAGIISGCFPDTPPPCTREKQSLPHWRNLWKSTSRFKDDATSRIFTSLFDFWPNSISPVDKGSTSSNAGPLDGISNRWQLLFWAKLIRAKIQNKRTDCYFSRLDEVVAFLENNLPRPELTNQEDPKQVEQMAKLLVVYLLELSTDSIGSEQLGYAERAWRVLKDYDDEVGPRFKTFYELWARYNIGTAHFHQHRYRQAVSEFNKIIWDVEDLFTGRTNRTERKKERELREQKMKFSSDRHLKELLYLPAVRYRADIQLKLQLAYHSLETIDRRVIERKDPPPGCWSLDRENGSTYKDIQAKLIAAEAYLQMKQTDSSWKQLKAVDDLVEDPPRCTTGTYHLNPPSEAAIIRYPNLYSKLFGLFADFFLTKLRDLGPLDSQSVSPKTLKEFWKSAQELGTLWDTYFDAIESDAYSRTGFHLQMAESLLSLAKIASLAKPRTGGSNTRRSANIMQETAGDDTPVKPTEVIREIVRLWKRKDWGKHLLHLPGDTVDVCQYCKPPALDLKRATQYDYLRFLEFMPDFFKEVRKVLEFAEDARADLAEIIKEEKGFIQRLISSDKKYHEDLRVREWQLLTQCGDDPKTTDFLWTPCFSGVPDPAGFSGLLKCAPSPYRGRTGLLQSSHYERSMNAFFDGFLDSLKSASVHPPADRAVHVVGLQRWNSSSPAQGKSLGGGYLLYRTDDAGKIDLGVAIDPGFDFVRNLLRMGFSLMDIDVVLITHAHPDHCRDFESIVLLLYELFTRGHVEKTIHTVFTLSVYNQLEHIIEHRTYRHFVEPYIIDIRREIDQDYFEELPDAIQFAFKMRSTETLIPETSTNRQAWESKAGRSAPRATYQPFDPPGDPKIDPPDADLVIRPTRAYHDDHIGYSDSFGFKIKVKVDPKLDSKLDSENTITLGYTGDTKWVNLTRGAGSRGRRLKGIHKQYTECDTLLVHLGSLIDRGESFSAYLPGKRLFDDFPWLWLKSETQCKKCNQLICKKNHPYLPGIIKLLSAINHDRRLTSQLVLVSEFGEELRGGIRADLIHRLSQTYRGRFDFLPIDVGIDVILETSGSSGKNKASSRAAEVEKVSRVLCVQCNKYVDPEMAEFEQYGDDEGLFCVCSTCRKATSFNVLQDRLRSLYEVGRELRTGL